VRHRLSAQSVHGDGQGVIPSSVMRTSDDFLPGIERR
jgi:hypothetical protein